MGKIFFLLLVAAFWGCGNNSEQDLISPHVAESSKIDTLVIKDSLIIRDTLVVLNFDTTIVSKQDTIVVSKQDTIVVLKQDTIVVSKHDTITETRVDTLVVKDSMLIRDTTVISKVDTVIISKQDTFYIQLPDTGTEILDFNPESIMIPKLENLVHQKRDPSFNLREKQVVLLHFTDIHGDEENLRRIKEFYDYYSKYIDVVIHTGDALYDKWTDSFDFWANAGAAGFLNLLGNHDVRFVDEPNSEVDVTRQEIYDRFFAPFAAEWKVVFPKNAAEDGLMYYYKDIDKGEDRQRAKVRLIVLDEYHWDESQVLWLQNVLDDAVVNDFAVLICRHENFDIEKLSNCPFVALENLPSKSRTYLVEAAQAVDAFMEKGGEFIMWLGGHHHQDDTGVLRDYPKQLSFNGDVSGLNHTGWSDSWRKQGTKYQDSFTLIGIDRYEKIVRFVRVGADRDRYEREKSTMAINYATVELIY